MLEKLKGKLRNLLKEKRVSWHECSNCGSKELETIGDTKYCKSCGIVLKN